MAAKEFPLAVVIRAIDRVSGPLRRIQNGLAGFGSAMRSKFSAFAERSGLTASWEATKNLHGALGDLTGRLTQVATGITLVGGAAALAAYRIVTSFADAGGELNDFSTSVGMSAEKIQELRYAAKQNGVEQDDLNASLLIFSRNLGKAYRGKGPTDLLKAMRIRLKGANGEYRTANELLPEVADGLARITNPTARVAAAAELFGKSGAKLIPMLKDGSKGLAEYAARARELGLVISDADVAAADEFGDKLDDFKGSLTGLRNIAGSSLMPVLTDQIIRLTNWIIENKDEIKAWMDDFADKLPGRIDRLIKGFKELNENLEPLKATFDFLVENFGGANVSIGLVAAALTTFLLPALIPVIAAVWQLNVALWSNPIGIVILLILACVAALLYFGLKIEDGKIKVTEFGKFLAWLGNTPMRLVVWYAELVADRIAMWEGIIDTVKAAWNDYWTYIEGQFDKAIGWISRFADTLTSMIPDWAKQLFSSGGSTISISGAAGPVGASLAGQAIAQQRSENKVTVDFRNMPPGSRVQTEQRGPSAIEVNQGYAFGN